MATSMNTPMNLSMNNQKIVGIVNITRDSFSDGGRYLAPEKAIEHARKLVEDGADVLELGPASSHPDSEVVTDDEQISRLAAVIPAVAELEVPIAVDISEPRVQHYALGQSVDYINDIRGFPDKSIYPLLADAKCEIVVMYSRNDKHKAERVESCSDDILADINRFFEMRISSMVSAGISEERIILDPGMGFFLGPDPELSINVLKQLHVLKDKWSLPFLISVSRKSFLQKLTNRPASECEAATLSAELFAYRQGVDFIRTHNVKQLREAVTVLDCLEE